MHVQILEIEQRVELPGVPHHPLPGSGAEQRNQHALQIGPLRERFGQWPSRGHARCLDVLEDGRLAHPQPDVERDPHERNRDDEWQAPSPGAERLAAHAVLHHQDHHQRQKQPEGRRDLDEAGVEAAPAIGDVLGHVDGGPAVLPTERQSLQHANHEQGDRRGDPDAGVGREKSDRGRRTAHDRSAEKGRVFVRQSPRPAASGRTAADEPDREGRQVAVRASDSSPGDRKAGNRRARLPKMKSPTDRVRPPRRRSPARSMSG